MFTHAHTPRKIDMRGGGGKQDEGERTVKLFWNGYFPCYYYNKILETEAFSVKKLYYILIQMSDLWL